jgi:23S rRNA (uracil1939-C5)-methyltransferase
MRAAESEAQKRDWLLRALAPWAPRIAPLEAVAGEGRWSYRDRVCLAAEWVEEWRFGLLAREQVVSIPNCPVHSPRVRAAARALAEALPPGPSFPLRYYVQSGAQVTLVLKSAVAPPDDWLTDALVGRLGEAGVEGLWLHLFPAVGRNVFAKNTWRLLWGRPRSRDDAGLLYGPTAFQQLLPVLYRRALEAAERFLAPEPGDRVADLYCGGGATLKRWSARGAAVLGVELGGEAVACARENALGAEVLRGTCAARLPQLQEWAEGAGRRLLYANPPRTGLEPAVADWIAEAYRPARMAYLSCSAGTLRRDLERLEAGGLRVVRIIPYDFFPQTRHVETLVLLEQGGS